MGLGKPQRLAKFEVAGFVYYGNIRNLFLKFGINQNGETRYYWEKLTLPLYSQTQCLANGDFYEKPHFTMEHFKFWEAVKWGLKIFAPNYQTAHPYAKSGRTDRLAYVAVTLF